MCIRDRLNRLKEKYSKQTEAELDAWSEKLVESGVEIILHLSLIHI